MKWTKNQLDAMAAWMRAEALVALAGQQKDDGSNPHAFYEEGARIARVKVEEFLLAAGEEPTKLLQWPSARGALGSDSQ